MSTNTQTSEGLKVLPSAVSDEASQAAKSPFLKRPVSVQVQSVLYNNEFAAIERAVASLARAAELAMTSGLCSKVTLRYGDSSSLPTLSADDITALNRAGLSSLTVEYVYFDGNLGSARGHNELANNCEADFLLIQNPDIVVSPQTLEYLLSLFALPSVGMAEAKQLPIEHPKDYDTMTGETSWATTACAMIPMPLFEQLEGFDADSFFLYCDDVDFSWRVRQAGYKVLFQPAAVVFHDKRLTTEGKWQASQAEHYYSAEAAMFLAHKWSRPDLAREYLNFFENHGDDNQKKAAKVFSQRRLNNQLPEPRDHDHKIGQFIGFNYAKHRFDL